MASPVYLDAMRRIVRLKPGGLFELDLRYFRHHAAELSYQWDDTAPPIGDLFSPALEDLLGPRRRPEDPLDRTPPRYRALGAGNVRRGVLPPDRRVAGALRT